jgi:hypothetical protein
MSAMVNFNIVLKRRVALIKSSLLLKIQWSKHHYLSEHGCNSVREFWSCDHNDAESESLCREEGQGY